MIHFSIFWFLEFLFAIFQMICHIIKIFARLAMAGFRYIAGRKHR